MLFLWYSVFFGLRGSRIWGLGVVKGMLSNAFKLASPPLIAELFFTIAVYSLYHIPQTLLCFWPSHASFRWSRSRISEIESSSSR